MNAAAGSSTARRRRSRVILVRGHRNAEVPGRLAGMLNQPPVVASNLFDALSHVASSRAGEPIAAMIVPTPLLGPPHDRFVEAVRKLDPTVRLVGLSDGGREAAAPAGVDAALSESFQADDLRRALDDAELVITEAAPATSDLPLEGATMSQPLIVEIDDSDAATRLTLERDEADAPESVVATTPAAPLQHAGRVTPGSASTEPRPIQHPHVAAATAGPEIPGDTDLIDALLNQPEGVAPLALRIIAHHGRWRDVRLQREATDDTAGAPVRCGDHVYGHLHADNADSASLQPWADWLGRWLALEEERRRLRREAHVDELTGAWNRRFFESFLSETLAQARLDRRPVTVMVFDLDNFKRYNDQHGHVAGDEILREIVRLLKSIVRQGDIVCRIGGDEFVVVFADREAPRTPGSRHPDSAESISRRFQQAVCSMRFPKLGVEAPGSLSISAGLATFPWDGQDAPTLLHHADERALESKRRGKNTVTLGRDSC